MIWQYIVDYWPNMWFVIVPAVIFIVKPTAAHWIKSGRIVFLFVLFEFMGALVAPFKTKIYKPPLGSSPDLYTYAHDILLFLWGIALLNLYIGWWEFLWRCIYRQWSKKIIDNVRYGIVSSLCVLGSLCLTFVFLLFSLWLSGSVVLFNFLHG